MAETPQMMEMSVESLARMNVNSRLRERAKVADEIDARAAVFRGAGKEDLALALDEIAEDLRASVAKPAVKLDTGSPYGSSVADVSPTSAELDPAGDGSGLPAVHVNDDDADIANALHHYDTQRIGGAGGSLAGRPTGGAGFLRD